MCLIIYRSVNSVGSLGKSGGVVNVEKINIRDSSFKGTTNGVRIKTWQVGQGNIRHITFENLVFDTVDNPIIIDQNYCDVRGKCKEQVTILFLHKHTYIDYKNHSNNIPFFVFNTENWRQNK